MKAEKFLLVVLSVMAVLGYVLLFSAIQSEADELVLANHIEVTWENPVTLADGATLPETDKFCTELFLALESDESKTPIILGNTCDTNYTIQFNSNLEGKFYLGLRTTRNCIDNGEVLAVSDLLWSDNPALVYDGITFRVGYYRAPGNPFNLRPIQ